MFLNNYSDDEIDALKIRIFSSLIDFTEFFYMVRYNRPFIISEPPGRRSHYIQG